MFPLKKIALAKVGQSHSAAASKARPLPPVRALKMRELNLPSDFWNFIHLQGHFLLSITVLAFEHDEAGNPWF